jgi:DNA-binding transcriptional LysR family regulator
MDIRQLQNFLKVASTLHFTKAAEDLYIAQPALSRQIQQLEEEVKAGLLKRDKRNVELTMAGKYFQTEIEKILYQLEKVCKRTEQIHKGEAGEIRIGYTNSAMQTILPKILIQIREKMPEMKTVLIEMTNIDQTNAVLNRTIDVGFTTNPFLPNTIMSKVVFRDNFVVVLPDNHVVTLDNFKDFAVFKDENFIFPPKTDGSKYVGTVEEICKDAGFTPKIIHETASATTAFRLVEAGMGITIEPKSSVRGQGLDIKFIELNKIPQKAEITMVWHSDEEQERPMFFEIMLSTTYEEAGQ